VKNYVLDSYAVLTYLQNEAGADRVEALLAEAQSGRVCLYLSAVNFGEVAYIVQRKAGAEGLRSLLLALDTLPLRIVDATRELALRAAGIKAKAAIAYADCFAVALAQSLDAPVVTGDPEFGGVAALVSVEWLPPNHLPAPSES
jgi:ribonuclease VapC